MQKKFLFVSMIILSCTVCHAQVQKGSWLLGGTLGVSSTKDINFTTTDHVFSLIVNPEAGWAIGKNSVLGLYGGITHDMVKDDAGYKQSADSYGAGAFWRRFFPFNEKTGLQANLSAIYVYGKSSLTNTANSAPTDSRVRGINASLIPGFYFTPSKKIMLNAWMGGLSYSHQKYTFKTNTAKTSTLALTLLSNFSFGVDFLLNNKQ